MSEDCPRVFGRCVNCVSADQYLVSRPTSILCLGRQVNAYRPADKFASAMAYNARELWGSTSLAHQLLGGTLCDASPWLSFCPKG